MKVSYPGNPGTLKTNADLLFGDCFFPHFAQLLYYAGSQQVFLGSSTQNAQVQRQLRPLSRATKTSVFFHGADTILVLRAKNTGMHQV